MQVLSTSLSLELTMQKQLKHLCILQLVLESQTSHVQQTHGLYPKRAV